MALEDVRAASFPAKPSRLDACFCCPTEESARGYRDIMATKVAGCTVDVLYEVEKADPAASEHRADYNVVQELPGYPADMKEIARLYWTAGLWITIADRPGLRCEEVVTTSPLRIVRRLDQS